MAIAIQETHTWSVTYQDGTELREYEDVDALGHGFADVDMPSVKTLHLLPLQGDLRSYRVDIPDDAVPVFFRRCKATFSATDDEPRATEKIHCIGWKRVDQAVYLFVWDDGNMLLSSDLQAV